MSRKIQLMCFLVLLGLLLTATQSGFAQSVNGPLNFGNNYFVTGDYVVAGAQGMNEFFSGGYAIGTITVPDPNPGITGAKFVPPGAEVVAALLYWQTVEKTGTVPGQAGSGENGYFMPVVPGGPKAPGYPITGVELASSDTVAFSSGGCTGTSTGKLVRTYRANVLAALPRDPTGNISANGVYEVYLPSVGNNTPLTLGASLVLIYRILSPSAPLNSVVIYDGAYAPGTNSLTMKQTVQGFYDTASSPVSRLTHIVGGGKSNKFETVYLNNTQLTSLYGREPAFPGYYGTWDNPTWTFSGKTNPILAGVASATTEVIPNNSQEGCVSWGALIVSTTVASSDGDGLVDAWKVKPANGYKNPGYCDASVNEGVCTPGSVSWVDLPGAIHGEKDVFIQLDYMCSSPIPFATAGNYDSCTTGDGVNYSFDPRSSGAVTLVTSAFTANPKVHPGVVLHINPLGTNQPDIHAIAEQTCTDAANELCTYPEQPGVVAWKGGFDFIKNQLVDSTSGQTSDCAVASPPATCVPRFQPGRRTSWHYALSAHAVGEPKWKFPDDSLEVVKQSGNTVTFTTDITVPVSALNNVNPIPGDFTQDPSCPKGRVTIIGAGSNPNLNGTFCVQSVPSSTSFTITVGGTATTATYTYSTDPNLAVAPGVTGTASGVSDVGGADSLVTLGLWGNPAVPTSDGQTEPVLAGTFMHELGHSLGLTHGGYTYPLQAEGIYVPTLGPNCKPNFQSVMNYQFQATLLAPSSGGPNVPDYSGQVLASLNKAKAQSGVLTLSSYLNTYWYAPYNSVGSPVIKHCDGSPNTNNAEMAFASDPPSTLSWAADQDINFDGNTSETLQGYNDWANIDLRQIGATGTNSTAEGGGQNFGGGGQNLGGGGQNLGGGGQNLGGGGQNFGGGGQNLGGGGQNFGGGGQNFGGGGEVDVATINSVTRPPQNLAATEAAAPRTITLNWSAPAFGQIGSYNVYRAVKGSAFAPIASVPAPALTYIDKTAICNATGYEYFVTAVLSATSANPNQESVGSNTVSAGSNLPGAGDGPLTGCYTNTPPTVTLNNLTPAPTTVVQGGAVNITWSLEDDYNITSAYVSNLATNSLVAIGPYPSDQGCPASPSGAQIQLLTAGTIPPNALLGSSMYNVSPASPYLFTYSLDTTNLGAGCYWFTLTLDSGQTETTTSLAVQIFVSDSNPSTPRIATTTLPGGTVGTPYNNTIQESGGTGPFTWLVTSGQPPAGMPNVTLGLSTGILTGTPCVVNVVSGVPASYGFMVKVTDTNKNFGTQGLTLLISAASTTTSVTSSSPLNSSTYTSTYGGTVTFTAAVAAPTGYGGCSPTGYVTFNISSNGQQVASTQVKLAGANGNFTASYIADGTINPLLAAGTYSISATYTSGDANFTGSSTTQAITQAVSPAPLTVAVTGSQVYGGTSLIWTPSISGFVAGQSESTVPTPVTGIGNFSCAAPPAAASVGTYAVSGCTGLTASQNYSINYNYADPPSAFTVTPAPLTAAVTGSQVYGGTSIGFMVGFTGFVNGQSSSVVAGSLTCSANVTAASPVGNNYMVLSPSCFGLSAPNYMISYMGETFTVLPAPLTANVTGTQVYGGSPAFAVSGYSGFVNGDNSSAVSGPLSCLTNATTTSNIGNLFSISNCSGLSASNYTISYTYGTLSVTPATLIATVTNSESGFTVASYATFVNADTSALVVGGTPAGTPTCNTSGNVDAAGNQPLACSGLAAPNYVVNYSYSVSSGTASPQPLTISVSGTQPYGGTPTYTVTYFGFVGEDTVASALTNTLTCTSSASNTSAVGTTPAITNCSGLMAANYGIVYVLGTVTITPAPLTIVVTGTSSNFTANSYVGLVNGDKSSVVTGNLSCTVDATEDAAHNNPIACSGLSAPSYYTIIYSYAPASVSGSPAPLTVAVNGSQVGAQGTPTYTVTYFGFINGDLPVDVAGMLSCTTGVGGNALSKPIASCTGISAPTEYAISWWLGNVKVLP